MKSLKCYGCGKEFDSKNQLFKHLKEFPDHTNLAPSEEIKTEIQSIISSLNRAKAEAIDYVGLDPKLRYEAQRHFSFILSKPLDNWIQIEVELYRVCVDFPGRNKYVGLVNNNNLRKIEHSLSMLCDLSQAQLKALGGIGKALGGVDKTLGGVDKTLGGVKVGTTIAGLNAAHQLGEKMGEDLSEMF